MDILRRRDLGERVQQYAEWLERRSLKWSSVANYLASLVQSILFAHATCEDAPSGSYDEVCNLRYIRLPPQTDTAEA